MLESIARSKIISEKQTMGYKNLSFFVNNSKNRLKKVKSGSKLSYVLESQKQDNKEVSVLLNNSP